MHNKPAPAPTNMDKPIVVDDSTKSELLIAPLHAMEVDAFKDIIKNIMDNSDGDFGFMDQARPAKISEKSWLVLMDALEARFLIVFNRKDFNVKLTKLGVSVAIEVNLLTEKRAEMFLSHL